MKIEDGSGATPEELTEEVVEAESAEQEEVETGADLEADDWGSDHPEDTLEDKETDQTDQDELSTEEEADAVKKKSPVQKTIDGLTRRAKRAEAQSTQLSNTNDFIMQELNKRKVAAAAPEAVKESKEPVFEDYEKKFADDKDKANREFLKDHQSYTVREGLRAQLLQEAVAKEKSAMVTVAQKFDEDSHSEAVTKKYKDFHAKVYHPNVVFNDPGVLHMVQKSPQRFDIAYRLASDEELRKTLNASSPLEAGAIIGNLQRLYASPVNKRYKTKAGKTVSDIGSNNKAGRAKEEDMDLDSFLAAEDKKQAAGGNW